ncbi:hypothetical protein OLX02_06745 [Novosphingobium sp. KCTC 2891]|uniref:hypothetical protein n=1 Tax=Novosphingobium sp. KCTC 2891 TaxID=2989730 RepID=UPI00222385A1|nr:hypothetical protein [Novosphingobium sp. KCTC 2891]MCW1382515.1 hypothetical protein [Novosphingobium sp. KCTC 2891]
MRVWVMACAAIAAAAAPVSAWADNPKDPAMRSAAARARDREIIRQLNLREAAMVRERDARYAEGWRAWREQGNPTADNEGYSGRVEDHRRDVADYEQSRAQYQRDLAEWRRAVAACRAGDDSACDG